MRHLNPANNHPERIIYPDKDFDKKLDFKDIKFPVKIRDIQKIEKRIPSTIVFLTMKINNNIQPMYQKNVLKKKLLIYY